MKNDVIAYRSALSASIPHCEDGEQIHISPFLSSYVDCKAQDKTRTQKVTISFSTT